MKPSRLNHLASASAHVLRSIALCAVPLATVHAGSATWNGTTDAVWATGTNWSLTPVPGTGDTATFDNAGNANTILDLGAGVTINTLAFDTASAAAYTIGSGAVGSQTLSLNPAGAITLSGTVAANQLINANVALLGAGTITNNSASTLTLAGAVSGTGFTLTKNGTGSLTLSGLSTTAANNYTGATIIDRGTINLTSNAAFTGGLVFGATVTGGTTTGSLNLANNSASFAGGLTVQTNSATANTISIGTGQALTTAGTVVIGANGGTTGGYNPASKLTVSGLGSWTHTASTGTFRVGNNSTAGVGSQRSAVSTLDLSGLAQFTADVRTTALATGGSFIVGDASGGANGSGQTLILSENNTISAGSLNVQAANGAPGTNRLALGSGVNVFNAGTLNVGGTQRGDNMLDFNGLTGTFKLRGGNTTGTANVNLGAVNSSSTAPTASTINLAGHSADLSIGTFTILNSGTTLTSNQNHTATFTFDSGTMTAVDVRVGRKQNNAASTAAVGALTATLNIGNGTTNLTNASTLSGIPVIANNEDDVGTSVGNVNIAGSATTVNFTNAATNLVIAQSSNGGAATGTLAISGGATTITRGITLANKTAGAGVVNGVINLTGGNLTLGTAGITTTAGTTSTLTLEGGSLNMNANAIGDATNSITNLNFRSGTLSNVSGINNGAGLTKTTGGTLTLAGTNTYTGATSVDAGTLLINGSHTGGGSYSVASSGTLGGTGSTASAINVTGVLSPGASIESFATGTVAFLNTSKLTYELQNTTGSGADLLDVTGGLSLDGLVTLDLQKIGTGTWSNGDKLTLISYTGILTANSLFSYAGGDSNSDGKLQDDEQFTFDGAQWVFNYNDTSKGNNYNSEATGSFVTMTVIPEPRAALLGSLALLVLLRRKR